MGLGSDEWGDVWGDVWGDGALCGALCGVMGRSVGLWGAVWGTVWGYGAQCGAVGRCAVLTEVAAAVCEPQPEGDESQQRQQHHHRRHNAAHVELTWGAVWGSAGGGGFLHSTLWHPQRPQHPIEPYGTHRPHSTP